MHWPASPTCNKIFSLDCVDWSDYAQHDGCFGLYRGFIRHPSRGAAEPSAVEPPTPCHTSGHFHRQKEQDGPGFEVGIACMPPPGTGELLCLVVNDESTSVQFATLQGDHITPGLVVDLIGEAPSEATLGTQPAVSCPERGDFGEFDGEGVAFAAPYFYVVGSHGCSRKQGEFRLSSFHLARLRVNEAGQLVGTHGQAARAHKQPGSSNSLTGSPTCCSASPTSSPMLGKRSMRRTD